MESGCAVPYAKTRRLHRVSPLRRRCPSSDSLGSPSAWSQWYGMGTMALGLTVVFLHSAAGLVGPLALGLQAAGPVTMPAFGYLTDLPPVEAAGIDRKRVVEGKS